MSLSTEEIESSFHIHKLKLDSRLLSYCDVCGKSVSSVDHYACKQCDFDICEECYHKQEEILNLSKNVLERLTLSIQNTTESEEMINFIMQRTDIQFSGPSLENSIIRSYPTFYLYDEHNNKEGYLIKATRFYVDKNGKNIYFFNSTKSGQSIALCKKSCDDYFTNHSFSLKISQYYPKLMALKEHNYQYSRANSNAREIISSVMFGASYGLFYIPEKFGVLPKVENSISGYILYQNLIRASEKHCGVESILTDDYHITPSSNFNPVHYLVPDHHILIDWSTIHSIPIIISIVNEIKKMYQNLLNENNQIALNIVFSVADDLQDGISIMKQNPLFSNQNDLRLINLADSSIKSLQIFMRLKSEPFTILNTTVLNVYQADLGREMHAFLLSSQLPNILLHLVNDIREKLTDLSQYGDVIKLDLQNPKPVLEIIYSHITELEVKLAEFITEICDKIKDFCKKIKNAIVPIILNHFDSIKQIISSNKETQIMNLKKISDFNKSHQNDLENVLNEAIKKNIIPDFYSKEFSQMVNEIAHFKHLVQLVKLACQIERRINDNIGIFNIDLAIVQSKESYYEYNIHIIV